MKLYVIATLVLCFFYLDKSYGQSNHYWTRNYGSESMLLNGSVIGGVTDLGAVYYNPARLALTENPAFIISADVYELNSYRIEDAIGNRKDLKQSSFGGAPSLAAGTIDMKEKSRSTFAYAILLRYDNDFGFSYRDEVTRNVLPNVPGDELFEGELNVTNNLKDQWFGGSWAYKLKDNFSFGVSLFGSRTEGSKGNKFDMTALDQNKDITKYDYSRGYSFQSYGILAKFGAAYSTDHMDLGMTITAPRAHLFGKGSYNYQLYFAAPDDSGIEDIYTNDYQSDLDIQLKSPLSIGMGASYHLAENKVIHFSAEYFGKISTYNILEAAPHEMQSKPDSTIYFSLTDSRKSIANAGVGVEWFLSKKVSFYGGFSTDFNAAPENTVSFVTQESSASNISFDANFYHVAGGVLLKFKGAEFTLGATHTSGNTDFDKPVNFPTGDNPSDVTIANDGRMLWDRWQFIVSFSVPFLKDYVDKLEEKIF
ncbi:long-chain fatty acid transport protein [Echinicola strongylocentroti]|uniref:Long-chain fatty acid transport protein n=1 Tax=Echinicola strongylocentroti TaxID=1795355 RepID=A0A2Z4IDE3_9BACT|nr:long-chain fatty acid transport protein [Echinicola strongylocentroti]AWW28747.1 long-chain fatty acid transport protein [Echinicola strongylocentroti]